MALEIETFDDQREALCESRGLSGMQLISSVGAHSEDHEDRGRCSATLCFKHPLRFSSGAKRRQLLLEQSKKLQVAQEALGEAMKERDFSDENL